MWSRSLGVSRLGVLVALAALLLVGWALAMPVAAQDTAQPADMAAAVAAAVQPETCVTCHSGAGDKHQAAYDELYQEGAIAVTDLAYTFTPTGTTTITFNMTKDGAPFNAKEADSLAIYFAPYTGESFQFEPAAARLSLLGTLSYDGAGGNTSTLVGDIPDLSGEDGVIVLYGADETVGRLPARIRMVKYPFAALLETGDGVDYVSPANNDGCEKCHTDPYLKHGNIMGQVGGDLATDFITCKACHLDNGEGEHVEWQLLVDDPAAAAAYLAAGEEAELTPEQHEKYAYRTTLMNDVHMSHAMEFPYPQSMSNCVTCHAGKLDTTLSDENFTLETCKSCHPMTGSEEHGTAELALVNIIPVDGHEKVDINVDACNDCHEVGKKAPGFSEIHTGYDTMIFADAAGLKYADAITVTIDSAAFDGSNLAFSLSAVESPDIPDIDAAAITPTVMVGLYGYDTKDFLIGAHERLIDDNGDGVIDNKDSRTLEAALGEEHPRITVTAGDAGTWNVTADLSPWAELITSGAVKRVEIAAMPELLDAAGEMVALNAPSRTFDLAGNDFADDFYAPIAKVADGCNNCHEALATNFHSPDRGGNLVVCRMCHITKSGGSHLEMQSRSLDSYVHAIHAGQAFDIADIDFADPVAAMHYEHHIEFPYPKHGADCLSCHLEGTFNVPDQTRSLPGILSATEPLNGWDRAIPDDMPAVVVGPASRACGGCHRAALINEDAVGELIPLNQHMKQGGYQIEAGEQPLDTLQSVIDQIVDMFN